MGITRIGGLIFVIWQHHKIYSHYKKYHDIFLLPTLKTENRFIQINKYSFFRLLRRLFAEIVLLLKNKK